MARTEDALTQRTDRAASISVIVPTYNRAHCIQACLDSLLAQTVPALEILVIDDGSKDDTLQRLAAYEGRITVIHKPNGGKPSAVNLGLQHARGDWVWIFDDDDIALPEANAQRLQALHADPAAGFVYGAHYVWREDQPREPDTCRLHTPPEVAPDAFFFELMRSCFWHLGTALVRRELVLELGGLDPALLSGEDYDLQMRIARVARPAWCAAPVFYFRKHPGLRGSSAIRYSVDQRSAVFRKYSRLMGLKLRSTLALGDYLVPRQPAAAEGALSHEDLCTALLNRIEVMCNHGCVAEMLQDLQQLLQALAAERRPLTGAERAALSSAVRQGWAYEAAAQDWRAFLAQAAPLKRIGQGRAALQCLAGGLLRLAWSYPDHPARRARKLGHAVRLAAFGIY